MCIRDRTIRLSGKGEAGINGGGYGDLLVTVYVKPHSYFIRKGMDIYSEKVISFTEAILGGEITINTVYGEEKYTCLLYTSLLKSIGRIHTAEEFERNFYDARAVGFDNINLDLMFSLPGQSLSDWRETLKKAVGLNPEHISAYSLIIEEGTPFYDMYQKGIITVSYTHLDVYKRQ